MSQIRCRNLVTVLDSWLFQIAVDSDENWINSIIGTSSRRIRQENGLVRRFQGTSWQQYSYSKILGFLQVGILLLQWFVDVFWKVRWFFLTPFTSLCSILFPESSTRAIHWNTLSMFPWFCSTLLRDSNRISRLEYILDAVRFRFTELLFRIQFHSQLTSSIRKCELIIFFIQWKFWGTLI